MFDSIIACGDSFTKYHMTADGDMWPKLLSRHYEVPHANLARGGSSNYEIALQPLQHTPDNMKQFKKPLIIFGMTTPWRLPILYPMEGIIGSIDSILPEHLRYNPHTGVDGEMLNKTIKKMIVKDLFDTLDRQSIQKMMNWKKLIPDSTVIWGTIHFQHSMPNGGVNKDGVNTEKERIKRLHHYLINSDQPSYCFNEILDWFPLSHALQGDPALHINMDDKVGELDHHPNDKGIQIFADYLIKYIDSKFA